MERIKRSHHSKNPKRKYTFSEVESEVKKLPNLKKPHPWNGANYIGAGRSRLRYLDVSLPALRQRSRDGFSFSHLPPSQQFQVYNQLFQNSDIHEAMTMPLLWLEKNPETVVKHRKQFLKWHQFIDNWALGDGYCNFISSLLEQFPKEMMPVLKKWSLSKNSWARRFALVSLFYYAPKRIKPPPKAFVKNIIETLAYDEDYFVQRGLGWAIRECWSFYPDLAESFLKKHAKHLASITWTTALERVSMSQKKKLVKIRKR